MRDNNFTDKQIRGLDLVFKVAKKKFPFIIENYNNTDDRIYKYMVNNKMINNNDYIISQIINIIYIII